jgi:hypothetical protein
MGAVVVQHDIQVRGGVRGGDLLEEPQVLLVAVPRVTGISGDFPVAISGAVSSVMVPCRT